MSTSTSTYRSVIVRSAAPPGQPPASAATLLHVLWLSGPALIDSARLGCELDETARPPSGIGFSAGSCSLGGSPCAVIQIFGASASELHRAAERAKQLAPGCLSMAFDAHPGFDLEAAVAANLDAMGLSASMAPAAPSAEPKRI